MRTKLVFVACFLFLFLTVHAQTWQWTHPEPNGREGNETDDAHDVETDASGNVYVLGNFSDSLFLNNIYRATGNGSYVAKYDSTGALLWYKLYIPISASGTITATDLTVNASGVFVTGKYTPSYYTDYDCSTGTHSQAVTYSYKIGSVNTTSSPTDAGVYVQKLGANGNQIWLNAATSSLTYNGGCLSNSFGIIYNPLITTDKNNNIICEFLYPGGPALQLGGLSIPTPAPTNNFAIMVVKLNSAGKGLWSNYAANEKWTSVIHDCNSMATDNAGNVFLYGLTSDSCRFGSVYYRAHYREDEPGIIPYSTFIAKISSSGTWQFAKELCNSSQNFLEGGIGNPDYLTCDQSNNVYALVNLRGNGIYGVITGDTVPTDKTNTYLVKLNGAGKLVYHNGFATTDTYANSISFANNSLYISGGIRNYTNSLGKPWYFSNLTVKPTSPDYGGAMEYFVSKATTNADFQWVTSFSSPYNLLEGFAVKASGNNIYTSGFYIGHIESLGNLNGTYNDENTGNHNLFFGKLKDQYIKIGAITPTVTCAGGSITIPFTSLGLTLSAGNTFTAELSDANGSFASPVAIGSVASSGSGSVNAILPASVITGNRYVIRIKSSDTLATGYNYYAYADTGYQITIGCPAPTGFTTTDITATSAKLNWTSTNCSVKYSVQTRPKGTTAWKTATVAGTATSYTTTGLTANKTYQWRVATICQSNPQVMSAYGVIQQFTTAGSLVAERVALPAVQTISSHELKASVSPNPVQADAVAMITGTSGTVMLKLTDVNGRLLWTAKTTGESKIAIPMQNLPSGLYILSVRDAHSKTSLKISKAN